MILRLRTGSETLILGPRSAFAGLAGRDRRALVSEYEVRRRLRLALADPEGADALRRAFALWREEGARIREADDHALIDRVARMSRNGALAAFVVQDRAKGLGVSTAAAGPGSASPAGANVTGANVTGMNLQERLAATLRLVPNHLSGTTKQAFAELIEPKALATTVEVLALWAISHAFGAGEAIDAVLLAAGLYFGGAQVWGGLHALFHALDLIRMAQSVTQLDEAAAIFAEGVTKLGIAVLIAALTHGATKKAARWTEKKPSLRNTPQERAPKAERFEERPARTEHPPSRPKQSETPKPTAKVAAARLRQQKLLDENVGYNVSPIGWDRYPTIGRNGTYLTDREAISSVIGEAKGSVATISKERAAALEQAMGLEPGSLAKGFKIRRVEDVANLAPRSPLEGNSLFLGPGRHLPGGGPEIVVDSIPTTDSATVKTLTTVLVQ
ncbi:hypothetical protein [Methylosinus sp. LW3]|uniref:hypothetical protein n=1 Tax=Methylosinus sp. LW3 TaxID=107635 RepID=UPI0004676020|nr:hypothetical protein [Methylosinus sp. LW3]